MAKSTTSKSSKSKKPVVTMTEDGKYPVYEPGAARDTFKKGDVLFFPKVRSWLDQGAFVEAYGRIVNVSSVTGPLVSNPGETAYSAGKAALVGMSRSLAIEVAKYNITVNSVAPGWIGTGSATEEEAVAAENTPMGRAGTPQEVADLIAFLASDESTYITGQMIVIDGGNTIQEYKGPREGYY